MLELLSTIAILCQVQTGANIFYRVVERNQKDCQIEYIKCVGVNDLVTSYGSRLANCITEEQSYTGKSK